MLISLLQTHGYWGMMVSSFLAGSILPFSSEAVLVGLLAAGLSPVALLITATTGNVLGSVVNYLLGRQGRLEYIERYLHVSPQKLERARKAVQGRGAWMGFFAFVPLLGTAITIALGLMRSNPYTTFMAITLGKVLRYAVLIVGTLWAIG